MSDPDPKRRRNERGFTLLEILIAMIVLAVGGVSILSLFTAAVKLQFDSVIDQRTAQVSAEVVAKSQEVLNAHRPTPEKPLPDDPDLEKWSQKHCPPDFTVSLTYRQPASFPPGEGAVADITIYFRDKEVETISHILQRTVISEKEIEESKSYREEQAAKKAREGGGEKDR